MVQSIGNSSFHPGSLRKRMSERLATKEREGARRVVAATQYFALIVLG